MREMGSHTNSKLALLLYCYSIQSSEIGSVSLQLGSICCGTTGGDHA